MAALASLPLRVLAHNQLMPFVLIIIRIIIRIKTCTIGHRQVDEQLGMRDIRLQRL